MKVSFFKTIKNTSPQYSKDVGILLDRIREGKSQKIITQLRVEPDPEKIKEIKMLLPVVCFNGEFTKRANKFIKKPSGLMVLDFDNLDNPVEYKSKLSKDPRIFSCWISPSGKGVKALLRIPLIEDDAEFKSIFKKVRIDFPDIDQSGKDVARACFESYDPDIYVNINAEKFKYVPEDIEVNYNIGTVTNIPLMDQDEIANRLMIWFKKHFDSSARNNSLFKLASAFNDFGVTKFTCETYLINFEEPDFTDSEIRTVIASAYKKTSQFGTRFFEDKPKRDRLKNMVISGKKESEIKEEFKEYNPDQIVKEVETIKKNIDISTFWEFDHNGKIKINPYRFKIYLESMDYFKYFPIDQNKPFVFITKNENFIDNINEYKIKDIIMESLINENHIDVFNLMAVQSRLFTPQYLSMLETANVEIEKDGKDYAMIYYRNCAIKVFKDYHEIHEYNELDGFVWKNQIIDRDFTESDHHDSMFRTFIWKISGEDVERYNTIKSVIGYLLHSYKTSANNRAIILNDETISETPNGGSGKGILINAIGHMKRLSTIDGKTFDFNKSFAYQTVSTDCQVLAFDDVKKNFEFERLFSLITEGITIEYKNQGAVKLPVKDSPKIVISTNYTIKTTGGSFERRVFEVELSSFFNVNHTPLDEFGIMLFEDWTPAEWSMFDKYMINCLQFYLENGLVKSTPKNLALRKFINETCQEFFDFVEDNEISLNVRVVKNEIYSKFKEENEELKWLSKRLFLKWIKLLADFKGYTYTDGNSNGQRWFVLGNETKKNDTIIMGEKPPF
jgi:hypothetical protein